MKERQEGEKRQEERRPEEGRKKDKERNCKLGCRKGRDRERLDFLSLYFFNDY